MQKRYELSVPQTVFGGVGALQNISRVLKDNHVKKVALFTGKRVRAAGLLDAALEQMREAGVGVVWWISAKTAERISLWPSAAAAFWIRPSSPAFP